MLSAATDPAFRGHLRELRDTWQARLLAAAAREDGGFVLPNGVVGACVLSVLADNFDDAMPTLLVAVFPGYRSLGPPMLCSSAKVAKTGHIMADVIRANGQRVRNQALFLDATRMQNAVRRFADGARLADTERIELFAALKKWVVADFRLDPTMDPQDPDAKRLRVN